MDIKEKTGALRERLFALAVGGRLAVAFSGGLDSRFLAHTAARLGLSPVLLHAAGPHIARAESRFAREWAAGSGLELRLLEINPLGEPEVAANGRQRCYHCKRALFGLLKKASAGLALCDGTQASDSGAYRPGLAALRELRIASPLAECGLSKPEIRKLAAETGMELPGQRARPCLLTRFAYGLPPAPERLAALDRAEEAIDEILNGEAMAAGRPAHWDFRLRWLSDEVAELHLTLAGGEDRPKSKENAAADGLLPEGLDRLLAGAAERELGHKLAAVRVVPELSGFFDRN